MNEPFFMQWHITDRCMLNCAHCYREELKEDLPSDHLAEILGKFSDFLRKNSINGRINFGGGEPLLRKNELLWLIREASIMGIQCRLLTNGLLMDNDTVNELKYAGCSMVQVSIDGGKEVHDSIRGASAFDAALKGAHNAKVMGMKLTISMTISKWNVKELDAVAEIADQLQARLFISRHVPYGHGANMRDQILEKSEWLRVMRKCLAWQSKGMQILLRDPLFTPLFWNGKAIGDGCIGGCSVGYRGISVDSNGDVYPCRRMPVVLGNLLMDSFDHIWRAPLMDELRNRDNLKGHCGKCRFRWVCGGCRAIAFAYSGDALAEDPQCSNQDQRFKLSYLRMRSILPKYLS